MFHKHMSSFQHVTVNTHIFFLPYRKKKLVQNQISDKNSIIRQPKLSSRINSMLFFVLQVYCRIRPLDNPDDPVCIKPQSTTVVHLTPPEVCVSCVYQTPVYNSYTSHTPEVCVSCVYQPPVYNSYTSHTPRGMCILCVSNPRLQQLYISHLQTCVFQYVHVHLEYH